MTQTQQREMALRKRPQDPDGFPKAMTVSALEEKGLAECWAEITVLADWRRASGDGRRSLRVKRPRRGALGLAPVVAGPGQRPEWPVATALIPAHGPAQP